MFYARTNAKLWKEYPQRALVNMQMRFDGKLGFPGGLIDDGEDVVAALNREIKEEMGEGLPTVRQQDWICTHHNIQNKIILHFFCKEVSEEEFLVLEGNANKAVEFGVEVLGVVRVPLYTMERRNNGFPQFLANNFCGNSMFQLLLGLYKTEIFSLEEIKSALSAMNKCSKQTEFNK